MQSCPPEFQQFFRLWVNTVPTLQRLPPDYQHDVARLLCDLPPLASPIQPEVGVLAGTLRSIAIEISQRRSFLERYQADLQAALNHEGRLHNRQPEQASFKAPPLYAGSSQAAPPPAGPPPGHSARPRPQHTTSVDPNLVLIRETLYSALADQLEQVEELGQILARDPSRAYFASVALAALEVSLSHRTPDGQAIRVVSLGYGQTMKQSLGLDDTPPELQLLVSELLAIGAMAQEIAESDDAHAMALAQDGRDFDGLTKMQRIKLELMRGAGYDEGGADRPETPEESVRALANRVNTFALMVSRMPSFQERAGQVFEVLAAVAGVHH